MGANDYGKNMIYHDSYLLQLNNHSLLWIINDAFTKKIYQILKY